MYITAVKDPSVIYKKKSISWALMNLRTRAKLKLQTSLNYTIHCIFLNNI